MLAPPNKGVPRSFPTLRRNLRAKMPELRGALSGHAPLAPLSWFKTGGPAQALFEPENESDLAYFLCRLDPAIPVLVLGAGSNILLRDGGVEGVVIRLGKGFQGVEIDGLTLRAGAGVPDVKLASAAAKAGIAGLSFFRGIPGSVGGALQDECRSLWGRDQGCARLVPGRRSPRVKIVEFSNADMGFSYRHCGVPADVIFTQAVFAGSAGDPQTILAEMAEITKARSETQPVNTRTGGSTFKNPPGQKAWELIDKAGCRGLAVGDAQVSELHCNFLINRGNGDRRRSRKLGRTCPRPRSGNERCHPGMGNLAGGNAIIAVVVNPSKPSS